MTWFTKKKIFFFKLNWQEINKDGKQKPSYYITIKSLVLNNKKSRLKLIDNLICFSDHIGIITVVCNTYSVCHFVVNFQWKFLEFIIIIVCAGINIYINTQLEWIQKLYQSAFNKFNDY